MSSKKLIQDLQKEYKIPSFNIITHNDVAPGRKYDVTYLYPFKGIGAYYPILEEEIKNNLMKNPNELELWDCLNIEDETCCKIIKCLDFSKIFLHKPLKKLG